MMKISVHAALFLFVVAGLLRDVPPAVPDVVAYSFSAPSSPSSEETTGPIYQAGDCPAIQQHFTNNPIPVGAIDTDNGREIIGWEIWCDDLMLLEDGMKAVDPANQRTILRSFGHIKVHYAS